MTATVVDGLEVIADEPTQSPISARNGQPVYWRQIRSLLLSDGTIVYGCAHCDYTRPSPHGVRPHLNKHRKRPAEELSLAELLAKIAELEQITAERDEWKAQALAAKKRLHVLRSALGGDS